MGEIIVIKRPSGTSQRAEPAQGSAEILFFTGVRYVRTPDVVEALASVTANRGPSKPRRTPRKTNAVKRA